MPANRNHTVVELLMWHGHDKGGVRVPFGEFGDPLGRAIDTGILQRVRTMARSVVSEDLAPRWLFLVGGPGNGKSQMVEEFIRSLDDTGRFSGSLVAHVRSRFEAVPTPRVVEIEASHVPRELSDWYADTIHKVVIIQDASATDEPERDAAETLVAELTQLAAEASPPGSVVPVLVCCVNRGLLARAVVAARDDPLIRELLEALTRATGLGEEALSRDRPPCWPILAPGIAEAVPNLDGMVACWPMDVESLLVGYESGRSAGDVIVQSATNSERWEDGACGDCTSRGACPFHQNAIWLRDTGSRAGLLRILRRQELASGQRWNFRSLFSLVAELIVGERDDFDTDTHTQLHPCEWVHRRASVLAADDAESSIPASLELTRRLYPHALYLSELPSAAAAPQGLPDSLATTLVLLRHAALAPDRGRTSIRRRLVDIVRPAMDPATWSPEDERDPLYVLEDAYSQSVALGNSFWGSAAPAAAEEHLLDWLRLAESEVDDLVADQPARGGAAQRLLRQIAVTIAKRSVATRFGRHAAEEYLAEYELTIRDADRLADLQETLKELLSGRNFRANSLAAFGQPEDTDEALVVLVANPVSVYPIRPAPTFGSDLPAHDLPAIPVTRRAIPLTFDLYLALRLRRRGCSSGTMPASVRASLDRIRQLYAGEACRAEDEFLAGNTFFEVEEVGRIVVSGEGALPRFSPSYGH